jgi:hypothetical protein
MNDEYVLVDQDQRPGRNGVDMWRLTFYCLDDKTLWEMTVDPTYDNFKRSGWDRVVRDPNSYGIYTHLKRTKRKTREGTPIVSADSPAWQTQALDNQQQALRLVELNENPPTPFQELFQ